MKGHVNSSGFPLQIGLKNLIDDPSNHYAWRTLYTEHAWQNPNTGEAGFIDLVVCNSSGTQYFVIECKRVQDTSWIFLIEGEDIKRRRHAKSFIFNKSSANIKRFEWLDLTLDPSTPESQFCVIPGTGNNKKTLIERAAAELVSSTEGLALESKSLSLNDRETLEIYFNVIVTTAKLQVCLFSSDSVSITDGTVANPQFEEVPYLRFRKQLNPVYKVPEIYSSFSKQEVARAKENTVFVVNSMHLIEFLKEFEIDRNIQNNIYLR